MWDEDEDEIEDEADLFGFRGLVFWRLARSEDLGSSLGS
jgi:hypothetical protein